MLSSHLELKPQTERKPSASPIPLPRLPPISSLLAGIDQRHDEAKATATYGSLPNPHTFDSWDNASPFTRSSKYVPSQPSTNPSYPPSNNSSRLAALAPITTGGIHNQYSLSSVRLSPEPQPAGQQQQQQQQPRRIPSMQLVSPTGGPLHPLPSGLVGFPPVSSPPAVERTIHSTTFSYRPRSNSASAHPYAGPFYGAGRGERADSINGERRTSMGWTAHDSSRIRKRQQEASDPADRYMRPRTASLSSSDEARPAAAWAGEDRDMLGLAGVAARPSSSHSSPIEPDDLKRGSIDSTADNRRSSGDSGRSLVAPQSDRSDTSPRMAGRPSADHYRPTHNLAPDLAALRLTAAEAWRGLNAPAPLPTGRRTSLSQAPTAQPAGGYPPSFAAWPGGAPPASAAAVAAASAQAVAAAAFAPQAAAEEATGDSQAESGRYGCPHCPKRFARPSSLRTHIHSHTGEKPFSCDLCGRGFSVQSNLRRHLKIHRGSNLAGAPTTAGEDGRPNSSASGAMGGASDEDHEMAETGWSQSEGEGSEGKTL